jgi:DNA-binding IclR family transcriptional regulator
MEVATSLRFPQSSTSALLRSLATLGYLEYNRDTRAFVTSPRVTVLGGWRGRDLFCEGPIICLMKELNERTGEPIVLGARVGLYVHYIHVIQATNPERPHMTLGTARPLVNSGAGYALLCPLTDAEVTRLALRYNAVFAAPNKRVNVSELLAHLRLCRQNGYSFTHDIQVRGGGIIATLLPSQPMQPPLVVGICGTSELLMAREHEHAALLRETVGRHLGGARTALADQERHRVTFPAVAGRN